MNHYKHSPNIAGTVCDNIAKLCTCLLIYATANYAHNFKVNT